MEHTDDAVVGTSEQDQPVLLCQAEGCEADLAADKRYCVKKRLCSRHIRADVVVKRGQPQDLFRFCFQCGKLEALERFDGKQRSCRDRLELRRKPKRANSSCNEGADGTAPRRHKCSCGGTSKDQSCSMDIKLEADVWQQQAHWLQLQAPPAQDEGGLADAFEYTGESPGNSLADMQPDAAAAAAAAACAVPHHVQEQQQQQLELAQAVAAARDSRQTAAALQRTTTALSCNGPAALLLAERSSRARVQPAAAAAAPQPIASQEDDLQAALAVKSHIASLQQQCQQLHAQLQAQGASMRTADPAARILGSHGVLPMPLAPQVAAMVPPAVAAAPFPDSPASAESDCTAVTAVDQRQLVDMLVAQLEEDAAASAAADALEAMIEQELLAAAASVPAQQQAKHAWALQLNRAIDSMSSAISLSALPRTASALSTDFCLPAPTVAAPAAYHQGAASMLAAQPHAAVRGQGLLPPVLRGFGTGSAAAAAAAASSSAAAQPDPMLDMRLMALQQQLSQLQGMIGTLRAQVDTLH